MPWCEDCGAYRKAEELDPDGGCPECHAVVGDPPATPWHFKLLVVAVVAYLGWRGVQIVAWVVEHL